jgi:formate hydrogenlyase transcriptional activator
MATPRPSISSSSIALAPAQPQAQPPAPGQAPASTEAAVPAAGAAADADAGTGAGTDAGTGTGAAGRHYALVLRAWESTNTERTIKDVLAAVADVLVPVVPFVGIGIIAFDAPGSLPYALHHVERGALDPTQAAMKGTAILAANASARPIVPYEGSAFEDALNAGRPHTCNDLMGNATWLQHEFRLSVAGMQAYAALPLMVQGRRIGNAFFGRASRDPFTPEQVQILADVSRAMSVAVANAIANEEVRRLRDQVEAENLALRAQLAQPPSFGDIVGDSPALRRVLDAVEQVAPTPATVLITGETGTGKEMIVRALHRLSTRSRAPLVKVNCAAIPETLVAAELFGHERGAFTGATERRKGRFEQAHGGTLFLDEIGELPPDVQVMLLRVLQEREFERLGGQQTVRVDVRIVAATNRDLAEAVRAGQFRSDLFYRLNVFPIHLPPLRERPEDIARLTAHFAEKHGQRLGRPIDRIDRRTLRMLQAYAWPGNVRELENAIERAVILAQHGTLRVDRDALCSGAPPAADITDDLRTHEREAIENALRASGGRISGTDGAAARLSLPPSTLEFRIKRLGIDKFRFRRPAQ